MTNVCLQSRRNMFKRNGEMPVDKPNYATAFRNKGPYGYFCFQILKKKKVEVHFHDLLLNKIDTNVMTWGLRVKIIPRKNDKYVYRISYTKEL